MVNLNSNNDGQKRCKCKKSKCLKLYCECFASGLFCDETCGCKDCFNNPDYEDTVEETRKQIQLRNPNAFSSKIRCLVESPTSHNEEDGNRPEPIAGKHKRGCTCKKSMCQKKYCECYQANVGCSDECRCQGCKNVFGKRPDYNVFNEKQSIIGSGFCLHEFSYPHNSPPLTPVQHLGHGYDPSTTGGYIPSPASANSDMMLGTSSMSFDMLSLDQQAYVNAIMNQCPDSSSFNGRHLKSVLSISPVMGIPISSTASGSYTSVITWPMTPETVFSTPKVLKSNEWSGLGHHVTLPGNK